MPGFARGQRTQLSLVGSNIAVMSFNLVRTALLVLAVCASTPFLAESAQQTSYSRDGLDWGGLCVTSRQQSPINLVASRFTTAPSGLPLSLSFGTGKDVAVRHRCPMYACAAPLSSQVAAVTEVIQQSESSAVGLCTC